jgi:hypothetical protein
MSGLFDKLQNELDIREKKGGITPLDLAELPAPLRKMMRTLLRKVELSKTEVAKVLEDLPADDRKEIKNLDSALKTLIKQGWLISFGEGDNQRYKVNLRRKQGSTLAASIFDKLEERMEERGQDESKAEKEGDE